MKVFSCLGMFSVEIIDMRNPRIRLCFGSLEAIQTLYSNRVELDRVLLRHGILVFNAETFQCVHERIDR